MSTKSDLYNTAYDTILNSMMESMDIINQIEEQISANQDLKNLIESEVQTLAEVSTNADSILQFISDEEGEVNTESSVVDRELGNLDQIYAEATLALDEADKVLETIKELSNIIDAPIDAALEDIISDDNIKFLFDENELEQWNQTKDLNDLPADPFDRFFQVMDSLDENLFTPSTEWTIVSLENMLRINNEIKNRIKRRKSILEQVYSDLSDLIETEESILNSGLSEDLDSGFAKNLAAQKGISSTGDTYDNLDDDYNPDTSSDDIDNRKYEEVETILKRDSIITDAGAHVQYEIEFIDGKPYYKDKYNKEGITFSS
jgi:hypothetical protein